LQQLPPMVFMFAAIWYSPAAAQAWLAAYLFWIGIPIGALFAILVHGLTGGSWGLTLCPATSAMLRTIPLLALFLIPILIRARQIYPWADENSQGWLDLPFLSGGRFFILRCGTRLLLP